MSGANIPLVNDPEQLKNIGESLKKIFDPFGIDVDYYVDSFSRAANPPAQEKPAEKKETEEKKDEEMKAAESQKQPEAAQMEVEKEQPTAEASAAAAAAATASAAPQDTDLIKLNASSPFAAASEALSSFLDKQREGQNVQPNAPVEEPVLSLIHI